MSLGNQPHTLIIGVRESGPFDSVELQHMFTVHYLFDIVVGRRLKVERLLIDRTKYDHLFSLAPEAIASLKYETFIQDVNPEFERFLKK